MKAPDCVVQHREAGGGAVCAAFLESHLLEYERHRVSDGRSRGEGEIDYAERDAHALRGLVGDELTHPRDLEGGALYDIGELGKIAVASLPYGGGDDAGT